jgi:colicin import membrane protein
MKKAYFVVPLIGLIIFGAIYWNFQSKYEARVATEKAAKEQQRQEKIKQEVDARRKAVEDAVALQEQRKKEKAQKEAQDAAEKEARLALNDAREKSFRDKDRAAKQVERLTKDIATEKDAIAKIEKEKEESQKEQAFLRTYVKQAEANQKSLEEVLNKIADADKAAASAAAAAAAAAKAKS